MDFICPDDTVVNELGYPISSYMHIPEIKPLILKFSTY